MWSRHVSAIPAQVVRATYLVNPGEEEKRFSSILGAFSGSSHSWLSSSTPTALTTSETKVSSRVLAHFHVHAGTRKANHFFHGLELSRRVLMPGLQAALGRKSPMGTAFITNSACPSKTLMIALMTPPGPESRASEASEPVASSPSRVPAKHASAARAPGA